jgi:hypothetical protein
MDLKANAAVGAREANATTPFREILCRVALVYLRQSRRSGEE